MKYILCLWFLLFLIACQGARPPLAEYAIARTALESAKKARAEQLAHGHWIKALQLYQTGQNYYKRRKYGQSLKLFEQAILHAERAENISRAKKTSQGTPF